MAYADDLKRELRTYVGGPAACKFMKGWRKRNTGRWGYHTGKPVALVVHHTAGVGKGVPAYVHHASTSVPYANFCIDRQGKLWVMAAGPVWHAGRGDFRSYGKRWARYDIPKDAGNRYMLGVEMESWGKSKDFTQEQKETLGKLARACAEASGWADYTYRLPRHKDWAGPRKVDTKYTWQAALRWARLYGGKVGSSGER